MTVTHRHTQILPLLGSCAFFAGLVLPPPAAVAEEISPSVQASKVAEPRKANREPQTALADVLQSKRDRKKVAIFRKASASAGPAQQVAPEKKEKGKLLSALLKKDPAAPEPYRKLGVSEDKEKAKESSLEKNQTILAEAGPASRKDGKTKESFIELVPSLEPVTLADLEKITQSPAPKGNKEKTAEFLDLPTLGARSE